MADLSLSGLASGFDWKSVVDQLSDLERAPQRRLRTEQSRINQRKDAVNGLINELKNLRSKTASLADSDFFQGSGTATSSDKTIADASASTGASIGTFKFKIYQLATASYMTGGAGNGGKGLIREVDTTVAMNGTSSGLAIPVSTGTFTITVKKTDGSVVSQQFTITSTTTLSEVLSTIDTDATLGIGASYNSATDKVSLTDDGSVTEIILGASGDTSNFLDSMRLKSNGADSVVSSSPIGGANLSTELSSLRFSDTGDAITSGSFKINGVAISFTTGNTLGDILDKINGSAAGVSSYYDAVNDRVVLTNKTTGSTGITVDDNGTNLLKVLNLVSSANNGNSAGSLTAGNDLFYTINDGTMLRSKSNIITSESSGLNGISVTALKAGKGVRKVNLFDDTGDDDPANAEVDTVTTLGKHGIATGDQVTFLGSDVPNAIGTIRSYFARPDATDPTKFQLHKTQQGAFVGQTDPNSSFPEENMFYELTADVSPTDSWVAIGTPAEVTVTVGPDTSKIKQTIKDWADQYNKVQSLLDTQLSSSTDANGKVTAGILANDNTVNRIPSDLRQVIMGAPNIADLTEIKRLDGVGYKAGGFDNKLSLSDESALDKALATNLGQVGLLFSGESEGLAVKLDSFIDGLIGDPDDPDREGSLVNHVDAFVSQVSTIDDQIKRMEELVQTNRQRLINSFISMEKAQQKINQQMQYINQRFNK